MPPSLQEQKLLTYASAGCYSSPALRRPVDLCCASLVSHCYQKLKLIKMFGTILRGKVIQLELISAPMLCGQLAD